MSWVRIDDQLPDHPKVALLSDGAKWTMIRALCYANRYLTDGVLPASFLATVRPRDRAALVQSGVWEHDDAGGVTIHDYHDYQSTRDEIGTRRDLIRRRVALFRDPRLRDVIRQRDRDRCRYCGHAVIWADRKGPSGGTYDQVDPAGENTLDNLVVACRGCQTAKGARTPAEAGMTLLRGSRSGSDSDRDLDRDLDRTKSDRGCDLDHDLGRTTPPTQPNPSTQREDVPQLSPSEVVTSPTWEKAKAQIQADVTAQVYRDWFEPLRVIRETARVLELSAPSTTIAKWLQQHYRRRIDEAVEGKSWSLVVRPPQTRGE